MKKWYQDNLGNVSSMRLIAVSGAFIGMAAVIASVVAMFMRIEGAVGMGGISGGLVTTAMTLKWAQKQAERPPNVEKN